MLTGDLQFARATVNLIWVELMGVGIVDPPFSFDLDALNTQAAIRNCWTLWQKISRPITSISDI